jgi:hypothetical protein
MKKKLRRKRNRMAIKKYFDIYDKLGLLHAKRALSYTLNFLNDRGIRVTHQNLVDIEQRTEFHTGANVPFAITPRNIDDGEAI